MWMQCHGCPEVRRWRSPDQGRDVDFTQVLVLLPLPDPLDSASRPSHHHAMPNQWTGKGNPYTRTEVIERLRDTVSKGEAIIAAGAGTGISAKFIEKGGADLIIIYNSGRFRMMGHGSTAGMMAYGDANAIAMEIGEYEVLPVVDEIPVICGVHGTDPRRRMWHWLGKVKDMGFSGVNNFPTHTIVDGHFRGVLEETGMSVQKEYEMINFARRMDLFSIVYVGSPEEAVEMAKAGADAIIAHVGTTVGGSIGVTNAVVSWEDTIQRTQAIIDAAKTVRDDIFFLCHGGPINTPEDADRVIQATDCHGFVGASSLERMGVEDSLTSLTKRFKQIPLKRNV
jgi:predicted TIM-barrel enzyme